VAEAPEGDEGGLISNQLSEGAENENRNINRPRASTDEWRLYYERADRARARCGDPFPAMIERAERRRRLGRIAWMVALAGLLVLATLVTVSGAMMLLEYDFHVYEALP
jgi:hypothetical protein